MSSRSSVRSCLIIWCREQWGKIPDNDLSCVHTCTLASAHACTCTLIYIYAQHTHTNKEKQHNIVSGDVEILGCVCTVDRTVKCIVGMVTLTFCSINESSKVRIAPRLSSSTSSFASKKNQKQWWDGTYLESQHLGDEGKADFLGHPQVCIKFEASLWYMKPSLFEANLRYMKPCLKNNIKNWKEDREKACANSGLYFPYQDVVY